MKPSINPLEPEDVEIFLADYWQKKPLLIRQAINGVVSPLTPDELAGLACESEVNARLVLEHPASTVNEIPWSVEYGPFEESRFSSLPESHWSLLVSDVEKHLDVAADLIDKFRFIPDWRIDDLMISYAPVGGSVGPHCDAYDVFLLQLQGQRQWHINPDFDATQLENTELSILKNFTPDQQWILNPGDMLYLPPDVAHHGIALDDCMTASIGFRAPAINTIAQDYVDRLVGLMKDVKFYTDPDLKSQRHPAEISPEAISGIRKILIEQLTVDDDSTQRWLGEYSSDPRAIIPDAPQQQYSDILDFKNSLQGRSLQQALESRFLFSRTRQGALLFVDGKSYCVEEAFAEAICLRPINSAKLFENSDAAMQQLILDLYHQGALVIHE
jgi:50S ribosomal protein L16 3-hydroxylase